MERVSFDLYERYLSLPEGKDSDNRTALALAKRVLAGIIRERLTPRQRQVIRMYYYERRNIPAIARELGLNKSTVSRTLARGVRQLHEYMKYYRFR